MRSNATYYGSEAVWPMHEISSYIQVTIWQQLKYIVKKSSLTELNKKHKTKPVAIALSSNPKYFYTVNINPYIHVVCMCCNITMKHWSDGLLFVLWHDILAQKSESWMTSRWSETVKANKPSNQISAFVWLCLCCINETYMLDMRFPTRKHYTLLLLLRMRLYEVLELFVICSS